MSQMQQNPAPPPPSLTAPLLLDDDDDDENDEERAAASPSIGGTASLGASLANILISVLGAGQLTLPFVMGQCGRETGVHQLSIISHARCTLTRTRARTMHTHTRRERRGQAGFTFTHQWVLILYN